ncbi:MAG TPA: lamin tail domain-containing protein [Thermoplasmata archaeon]|nr:lamin tail domain-containing protein [Thermoplasmata archaeon]
MDESYREWLSSIPGWTADKAQKVGERFPTYELLRAASRDELSAIEGLTSGEADALFGLVHGTSEGDASGHLFLCPECGSFAGAGATKCPSCGVEFGGSEDIAVGKELDAFLEDEDAPARICLSCGAAMAKGDATCGVCGREYRREELALLPGLDGSLDEEAPFCPRCGAYLFADESECAICGTALNAPTPPVTNGKEKGVVKDFLSRWQRVADATETTEAERLQEELDHYDRLLEADPTLERAWAKRAKVLEKLGRPAEAAESLAKAGELNPAREDQYRVEVQDVTRTKEDVPVLSPKWQQPVATAAPKALDPRLIEALDHYESLLRADPSLAVAWRTKGEILERLGRSDESRVARERADRLERDEGRALQAAAEGLRAPGLASSDLAGGGRMNGRVSGTKGGHTNGRTNGHTNGRTNGRVNGLSEGRVNGLTTGAVNGLTFGHGATNGLVNGNGFTNGRRGRYGTPRIPAQPHWSHSVVGIAAVVALMVIVPILVSFLSPSPAGPTSIIRIDGDFSDWSRFPAYADSPTDAVQTPDVNLVAMKVATQDRNLFVEAQVQGLLFQGPAANQTGSVFVFVDEDNDRTTGYPIGDLGADSMVEVYGWRDVSAIQHGVSAFAFNETGVTRSNDFRRFLPSGSADAAFLGSQIEIRTTVRDATRARVLVYAADNLGGRDAADGSVRPSLPTVVLGQQTVAPDIVTTPRAVVLRVTLAPLGGAPHVTGLNLTRVGDSADPVDVALYRDDGSGALDPADAFLSNASMTANAVSLAMNENLAGPAVYWVEARWTNVTPTTTFGLTVSGVGSNGTASFRAPETGLVYLAAAPSTLRVDGAFGDWRGQMYGQDLLGDVTNRSGATEYDANVDLLATAVNVAANFTGYVRVDGRMLGGQDIPTSRERTYNAPVDTDLDGVPDSIETLLGAGLSQDFNNDNRTDAMSAGDVDGDGVIDYPAGTDCWLNTTIPAWYPAPYAGRSVTRFICPIGQPPQEGVDVVYAYVDADNATSTGLLSDVEGRTYGFDYAMAVIGRNGAVNSSGLYAFVPARANPWALVQPIAVALDAHRMEFAVDASALNLVAGYRVVYFASDWRLGYDVALPDAAVARFPIAAQAATNLVINEVSPQPNVEWAEIANPTASAVPLNGWTLAINHGNKAVVVYTFSGTIGAWGSGQEYLAAFLPANSLPNGQTQLLLMQGTTVIDATTYSSNSGSGRTWARFKDPVSGVPADTNNDAVDFYLSLAPSSGRANDRHRPTIALAKTASRVVAAPGDLIVYTLYYNNTDTGMAKFVWVNDTLPAGVSFSSSSVPYNSVSGSTYGWAFTNVMPGAHAFTVSVQVTAATADGQVLRNTATLDYTDQLRRPLPRSLGWGNTTVVRPMITVVKIATPSNAKPGDLVTFTIFYNNTGSVAAGTVTIKDSFPSGLDYVSASPAATWTDGRTFYWNFTSVAPGAHSLTLIARVNASFSGSQLVNWAFLNYTTPGGFPLIGSSSSTVVAIPELSDMIFVAAVPLLIIGLKIRAKRRVE